MAESIEKFCEFVDLGLQDFSFVGVAHSHPVAAHLHNLRGAHDVGAMNYGIFSRREWFVLHELESLAMIHQCVSRDSCGVVISLCKAAVDHHQFSVCLYRRLPFAGLHRNVAVDYVAVCACHSECVKNHVANLLVIAQLVIISLVFGVGCFIGKEISLKCGHL